MTVSAPRSTLVALLAWALGLVFMGALVFDDMTAFRDSEGISINGAAVWGRDFVNVWSSGRLLLEDRLDWLYDIDRYRAWQSATLGWGILDHNYSYPPLTLLYTPAFGALPYLPALAVWLAASLALFVWAARPWLARWREASWLAATLPTTLLCLWAGHYGLILGALWLGAWHLLDRRPLLAGVLIGLMAVKPHLAILMPLVLLRRRAWTTIAAAALTVGLLVLASSALFGAELWHLYFTSTSQAQVGMVAASHTYFVNMMPTLAPALFAYGLPPWLVWTAQGLLAAGVAIALWRFQPADRYRAALATAIGTFLVLPYGFNYDMTVVGLAALLLMSEWLRQGRTVAASLAAFVLALPPALAPLNAVGLWIAPPALLALFIAALRGRE